ncbi:MAG: hypothetical protein WCK49_04885 [Myxococcaceae bacterium]
MGKRTKVELDSYQTTISYFVGDAASNLAIFMLDYSLPHPARLIQTSELKYLKEGNRKIQFLSAGQPVESWIDILESTKFTIFSSKPALIGSPVWAVLDSGEDRVIGLITGEKTAMRLDPYFSFISQWIKSAREEKERAPIVIPATSVAPRNPTIIFPAKVVESPAQRVEPKTEPKSESVLVKPPESLGCSCSQVRRLRR